MKLSSGKQGGEGGGGVLWNAAARERMRLCMMCDYETTLHSIRVPRSAHLCCVNVFVEDPLWGAILCLAIVVVARAATGSHAAPTTPGFRGANECPMSLTSGFC